MISLAGVAGLQGWQWLFLVEGVPTIFLGAVTWAILPDHPSDAHWLTDGLPSILKAAGQTNLLAIDLLSAIPYAAAIVSMYWLLPHD